MKLQKYLDIEINRKIIRFFLENLSSIDTSRGIATWINEDADKTEMALHNLAKAKILVSHATTLTLAYACTTDKKIIAKIRLYLARSTRLRSNPKFEIARLRRSK